MNGRDYVIHAVERAERVLSEVNASDGLQGDPLVGGAIKACGDLGHLKTRATLRTRNGAHLAYPVYEAAQNLEQAWADAQGGSDLQELKERMEVFVNAVETLGGALRDRTVIMT